MNIQIVLIWLIVGIVLAIIPQTVKSQSSISLIEFESDVFALRGQRPEGWTQVIPGVFARSNSATDATLIVLQSTTVHRVEFEQRLASQLQIEALPEPENQLVSASFRWDLYRFRSNVGGQAIEVSLALTLSEEDERTYMVMLQSDDDQHDLLREEVLLPVVTSLDPLSPNTVEHKYRSEDITFSHDDVTLAGTLTIPEGDGPFPSVVIISGSGPSLRSGSILPLADYEIYTTLADKLTQNGIIVLRYDDRGVGGSGGDYSSATLDDFAYDSGAAVAYLLERDEVDSDRIGLIGHSEGGIIAPQTVANREDIAFVITIGGPALEMTQVLAEQNRVLFSSIGVDTETAEAIAAQFPRIQGAYISGDRVLLREEVSHLIELQTGSIPSNVMLDQGVAQIEMVGSLGYWTYDVAGMWQRVALPILAVYGEKDTQVSAVQNAPAMVGLLGDQATVITINDMNHVFQEADTGLPNEYGQLVLEPMPELVQTLVDWVHAH